MIAHTFIRELNGSPRRFESPKEDDCIFLTEVLDEDDEKAKCKEMSQAKKMEICKLLSRVTS